MPENLVSITADKLCQLLGVENLHIIDSIDGKTSPSLESNSGCTAEMIISAIIIFAMIMITIIATTSWKYYKGMGYLYKVVLTIRTVVFIVHEYL